MKAFVSSAIIALLYCLPACAQNENWDMYIGRYEDKPGSVLVDMGLMPAAPDKKYPYLLITGPVAQRCNAKGIPANDEIPQLEEILSATTSFVTGVTAQVLSGTFTYNCQRLNYYYVKDTMYIRNALIRMYSRSFPSYKYVFTCKHDPLWITYRTFLYPDSNAANWMRYSKKIANVTGQQDSLIKEGSIDAELYFKNDDDRKRFAEEMQGRGYKVSQMITSPMNMGASYRIVVSKYGPVRVDIVTAMEKEMKEEAKRFNGFYYNWDVSVPQKPKTMK